MQCVFPFEYQGMTYYECTDAANPLVIYPNAKWCSINAVYTGVFVYCGTDNVAQGCAFMDDKTGETQCKADH